MLIDAMLAAADALCEAADVKAVGMARQASGIARAVAPNRQGEVRDAIARITTRDAKEGRIWANAQTWCILGGIADDERTEKCLASMEKHLTSSKGSLAFWPAFTEPDPHYGVISRFAPGVKGNGAVFSHNAMWRLLAETACGRGDLCLARRADHSAGSPSSTVMPSQSSEQLSLIQYLPGGVRSTCWPVVPLSVTTWCDETRVSHFASTRYTFSRTRNPVFGGSHFHVTRQMPGAGTVKVRVSAPCMPPLATFAGEIDTGVHFSDCGPLGLGRGRGETGRGFGGSTGFDVGSADAVWTWALYGSAYRFARSCFSSAAAMHPPAVQMRTRMSWPRF